MRKWWPLFLSFSIACCAWPVHAQFDQVSKIEFSIQGLSADAAKCGVTEPLIRQAIMYPLSGSSLNYDTKNFPVTLDVSVLALQTSSGLCFSSIVMRLHEFRFFEEGANVTVADDQYWDDHVAGFGGTYQHPQQVRQLIENSTKNMITAWNLARKAATKAPKQ